MAFTSISRIVVYSILVGATAISAQAQDQAQNQAGDSVDDSASAIKQVAVIGAGAGGASTAFHLARFAEQLKPSSLPVNITIFESTSRIGGRTRTTNLYDDPSFPVEIGATLFVDVNYIMTAAAREFDLPVITWDEMDVSDGFMGVWDGERFVYERDDGMWEWLKKAHLVWKYNVAPYRVSKLVKAAVDTFLKMYEPPHFPFRSLSQRLSELRLDKLTAATATKYLRENWIGDSFAHDIIQAITRSTYSSNLDNLDVMGAMVSLASEGAVSIESGNWRLFSSMIQSCKVCTLYDNTAVIGLHRAPQKTASAPPKYLITTRTSTTTDGQEKQEKQEQQEEQEHPLAFDAVVIAAPWQFANIKAGPDVLPHVIDPISYMGLYVTLIASPLRLSTKYFGTTKDRIPTNILTTLGSRDEPPLPGGEGVGSAAFYALRTVRKLANPKTGRDEFIYKIFSPRELTPEFLGELLDADIPPNFTGDDADGNGAGPISWYSLHHFWAYPINLPRATFQEPVLAEGLYYTSAIESFISTMETSALMGKNVAQLITDDFAQVAARESQGGSETKDSVHSDNDHRYEL